ncbi:MAG: hypothetical protein KAR42_13200 [candidate division Zixibacteria bacterium]|nr:hypothetical protein [candidate division Zixibacteria bacterium]
MAKFTSILYDTFFEIKDRKIFWLYWIVTFVMILVFAFLPDVKINGQNILESGNIPEEFVAEGIAMFFNGFFGFMMFLMVFGSAGLLPSYLSKGRVELALAKPISRTQLLLIKFLSVFLIMSSIFIVSCSVLYLLISYQAGIFTGYFFLGLLVAIGKFLFIYAILFFFGIAFNSTAATIMGYFIIWFVSNLLEAREIAYQLLTNKVWQGILDTAYHILPKFDEYSANTMSVMKGNGFSDFYPVWSSGLFGVIALLLAILIFKRRDY